MRNSSNPMEEKYKLFLMALPCIIFVAVFCYLPLWGWSYAFFNYKPGRKLLDCEFVAWKNFTRMFTNPVMRREFFRVLRNTFGMAGLNLICSVIPPVFAILINEIPSSKYRKVVQTVTTLPHFISWIIMYSLMYYMLNPNTGFINQMAVKFGFLDEPVNFLLSKDHVWIQMKMFDLWKELGWSSIVYLAAIVSIDQELYEAAMIDGAGRIQRILYITVPGLTETFFVLLVITIGNFLNLGMEQYYVFKNAMTKGSIEVLDLFVYNQGIGSGQLSYATAMSTMKTVVAVTLFGGANLLSKKIRGTSVF